MVLGGIAAVSLAAMIPLSVLAQLVGEGVVALVIGVPCAAIGFLVARRQPRHPLGWPVNLLTTDVLSLSSPVAVAAFAAGLKDAMDVTAVRADLTSVVQQTLGPAHVSLWISPHT